MKRIKLVCPICNQELQPSLGYGRGYWVCNCTITPQDKKEWVEQIEAIFKNKTGLPQAIEIQDEESGCKPDRSSQ